MRTIELPGTSREIGELLDQASDEDLVVRLPDGSEFLLLALDEFEQEVKRSRNNPELMALLDARAGQSATIPVEEVKRRLGL